MAASAPITDQKVLAACVQQNCEICCQVVGGDLNRATMGGSCTHIFHDTCLEMMQQEMKVDVTVCPICAGLASSQTMVEVSSSGEPSQTPLPDAAAVVGEPTQVLGEPRQELPPAQGEVPELMGKPMPHEGADSAEPAEAAEASAYQAAYRAAAGAAVVVAPSDLGQPRQGPAAEPAAAAAPPPPQASNAAAVQAAAYPAPNPNAAVLTGDDAPLTNLVGAALVPAGGCAPAGSGETQLVAATGTCTFCGTSGIPADKLKAGSKATGAMKCNLCRKVDTASPLIECSVLSCRSGSVFVAGESGEGEGNAK